MTSLMTKDYHRNPVLEEWEAKLKEAFDNVDHYLEDTYGTDYQLKPTRLKRGRAPTPDADGLFDLGVAFAAGFGSSFGPGYVFQVRMATLDHIPTEVKQRIEQETVDHIRSELARLFPDRDLNVERDGAVYKVFGDLNLDNSGKAP